jgi:mannose-1-phosphate guanylyltransferase
MTISDQKLTPIIMAGGAGSRLWPLSRASHPKQFLPLIGSKTLLQQTIDRLSGLYLDEPVVICSEEHRFLAAEQLREIDHLGTIILEPSPKSTAPAVALAALYQKQADSLLLILPADHLIQDRIEFIDAVKKAVPLAMQGRLVTFGVKPKFPATGYGYIKAGVALEEGYEVVEFKEKPELAEAQSYMNSGLYYWNSGIFLTTVSTYLAELGEHSPEILAACRSAVRSSSKDQDFLRPDKHAFSQCPSDSIDYALMEKTNRAAVVAMECDWSDIGSWDALWAESSKDMRGNVTQGDVMMVDSSKNIVLADDKLLALLGVEDLVVIDSKDALLVAKRERAEDIKAIVERLKLDDRSEWMLHRQVHRPWGNYDSIDTGEHYQVKRLMVKPGERLSLQRHKFRAEHLNYRLTNLHLFLQVSFTHCRITATVS